MSNQSLEGFESTITIKMKCPEGTVRIIFSPDLVQIFAGKVGTAGAMTAFALGGLISYTIGIGGSLKDIADILRGISYTDTNNLVFAASSIPDAVAKAIDEYLGIEETP